MPKEGSKEKLSPSLQKILQQIETSKFQPRYRPPGEIKNPPKWYDPRLITSQSKRKAVMPLKGLIGDVPYLRKVLPEIKPRSGVERFGYAVPKLVRDIGITSKITPLKGAKFLGAAGAFGAATAGTEKPKEIAGQAALTAGLFKATDVIAKKGPVVVKTLYEKLPQPVRDRFTRFGQSLGVAIKRVANFEKLKFQRHGDLQLAQIEGEKFARHLEQNLTKPERELIPFFIEKTGIPKKLNRPDLINLAKNPERRKFLIGFSQKLRSVYDKHHAALVDIYGDDVGYIGAYVNRLWNIPKSKEKQVVNWFMTRTGHTKKRLISTIQEGVNKFDLTPKTLDVAELYRYYNQNVTTAMANMRMVQGLKQLKTAEKMPMIMRRDKAPKDWVTIDHPVLRRGIGIPIKKGIKVKEIPVKVHPDIAEEMSVIFGASTPRAGLRALDGVNAFAKHSQLGLSLFHAIALTESAIATGAFSPKLMLNTIKAMKKGEKPILNDPLAKEWIAEGLQVGAPTDVHRNLVESSLMGAEHFFRKHWTGKVPATATKALRGVVNTNNRFLWDYYHPQLKLYAANKLYQDALKMQRFSGMPKEVVKKEIAQFVNDTFGGQNWALMTKTKGWQKAAQRLLLSPDWTLSTVRQALSPFGVGARNEIAQGLRQELGQNFWKSGMLILYSGVNNLNRGFSRFYTGESRNMWDNDPGHKTHLFLGYNPDGTKRYLRWGKQFRELPEFFFKEQGLAPISAITHKLKGKIAPVNRMLLEQFSPYPYGDLAEAVGTKREEFERVKAVGKFMLPFSVQSAMRGEKFSPLQFAFPVSKGMTYYRTINMFKEAIRAKDDGRIKDVAKAAAENELDPIKLYKRAVSDIQYEKTGGYDRVKEIYSQLIRLPANAWEPYIKSLNLETREQIRLKKLLKGKIDASAFLKGERKLELNKGKK